MRKWLKLVFVACFVCVLAACGAKDAKSSKPLLIGMEAGYPPYNWTQSDDTNDALAIKDSKEFANGYDVQIARKIGEKLGHEVQVVKTEWDGLLPALQANKIDLIIAGMSPTAERKEVIDFTEPYYEVQFAMVVRKNSPYANAKTLNDFEGAKVTGQLSTLHYDLLPQLVGAQVEQAQKSFPIMRVALEAEKIDAYISELPEAISATEANDKFAYVVLEPGFEVADEDKQISIGVKKGNPLLKEVNDALKEISTEERQTMLDKAIKTQPAVSDN